jgi:hypothetical protein
MRACYPLRALDAGMNSLGFYRHSRGWGIRSNWRPKATRAVFAHLADRILIHIDQRKGPQEHTVSGNAGSAL